MSESLLSGLFSYGVPVSAAILVSVFAVAAFGLFMANAGVGALIFFVVVMTFVNGGGGLQGSEFSVYTKGGGVFFLPIIQLYLYGLFLATLFHNAFQDRAALKGAGRGWMLAFGALFGCHVAYGLATGVALSELLSGGGLINVVHMSMIAYVAASVLRDEKSFAIFTRSFLGIAIASGCYGLGRFLLFGGDPENAYANDGGMNLRMTYWDFNEGLIAALVVFYCAGRLVRAWRALSFGTRVFLLGVVAIELLVILLSYRRTNWYGVVLAGLYFAWQLPKSKRAVAGLIFMLLMLPPVVHLSTQREQQALRQNNLTLIERIAPDVGAREGITSRQARFYELYKAFDTVLVNPVLGVGTWGQFEVGVSAAGLDYHRGNYGFVHSGFGHVLLKSGLIGLIVFCGILFSAWRSASRAARNVSESNRAMFESFRAGFIFLLPVLLFGSPIIEFRSMALLGVLLAVPVAIAGFASAREPQSASASRPMRAGAMRPLVPS